MRANVLLQLVIIVLLIIAIASAYLPQPRNHQPVPEVSWTIAYDEDLGKPVLNLKQDSTSRKVYIVGINAEGDPMTYDQAAFDDDLYIELYQEVWVFAENTWGVTVFHIWREGGIVKSTVNGISQKDYDPNKRPTLYDTAVIGVACL